MYPGNIFSNHQTASCTESHGDNVLYLKRAVNWIVDLIELIVVNYIYIFVIFALSLYRERR